GRAVPLLRVGTPDDARAALDAACDVSVVHRVGARWQAAARAANHLLAVGFGAGVGAWVGPGPMPEWFVLVGMASVLTGAVWLPSARTGRVENGDPTPKFPRLVFTGMLALFVAAAVVGWQLGTRPAVWWVAALLLIPIVPAVVSYRLALRHLNSLIRPPVVWPPGSEAFALLSCLVEAETILDSWLIECAGMPLGVGQAWIARLLEDGLVEHGGPRALGGRGLRITADGRAVRSAWRRGLTASAHKRRLPPP
ncbi:MAG: hypothetical protein ACRCZP_18965, partial [Phycicoccus sp.]